MANPKRRGGGGWLVSGGFASVSPKPDWSPIIRTNDGRNRSLKRMSPFIQSSVQLPEVFMSLGTARYFFCSFVDLIWIFGGFAFVVSSVFYRRYLCSFCSREQRLPGFEHCKQEAPSVIPASTNFKSYTFPFLWPIFLCIFIGFRLFIRIYFS